MNETTIALLHRLRDAVVADTGDTNTIVRLDCEAATEPHLLMMVVIYNGVYQPVLVEEDDFLDADKLIAYCLNFIRKHPLETGNK